MAQWFFDSAGMPIAFVGMNALVFHISGTFVGLLTKGKVWDRQGRYIGEVIYNDRLFRDKMTIHQPKIFPMLPYNPNLPTPPSFQARQSLPPGFVDLEFDERGGIIF